MGGAQVAPRALLFDIVDREWNASAAAVPGFPLARAKTPAFPGFGMAEKARESPEMPVNAGVFQAEAVIQPEPRAAARARVYIC